MSTTSVLTFVCSICGDPSHDICVYCTKDACHLHRCQRCLRCSDCCECELPLSADEEIVPEPVIAEPPAAESAPAAPAVEPGALTLAGEGAAAPELSPTLTGTPAPLEPAEPGIPVPEEPEPEPEPDAPTEGNSGE